MSCRIGRQAVARGCAPSAGGHAEHLTGPQAHRVEEAVRAGGVAEIPSHEVGLAILGPLRELDEVAYMRFASVYRSFSSIEDFEKEIADLRRAADRPHADAPPG